MRQLQPEALDAWLARTKALAPARSRGKLRVFGDSHSVIWGGCLLLKEAHHSKFPMVDLHHLGPALAFNLVLDDYALGKWGTQIVEALSKCQDTTSAVMLSFGEIDIRTQVVRRAHQDAISLDESAGRVADRLLTFAHFLRNAIDVPLFIWGPVASAASTAGWNADQPNVGTELERNLATRAFTSYLRKGCERLDGIYLLSILDRLVTPTFATRSEFFEDGCHLNLEGLGLAIAEFNRVVAANGLELPDYFDMSALCGAADIGYREIFGRCAIAAASPLMPQGKSTAPKADQAWIFHTQEVPSPFVLIDVGYGALIESIRIFNRRDRFQERARTLTVSVGIDPDHLRTVHEQSEVFGVDGTPLTVRPGRLEPVRFIMLRLKERTCLHLGKIEVFEQTLCPLSCRVS
jgi:hypothetical protein